MNRSVDPSAATHGAYTDPLEGERPAWWWTGLAPLDAAALGIVKQGRVQSLPMVDPRECGREGLLAYFANGWFLGEVLFSSLQGERAFMHPPAHGLRHPLIFYYGHTACLFVNKLLVAGLIEAPLNPRFERLFEVGVDEMSWDDMSKNQMAWPSVREVNAYRREVYRLVRRVIETHPALAPGHAPIGWEHPLWALLMGMEHERIHIETSSVLMRELPLELVRRPALWPALPAAGSLPPGAGDLLEVPAATVEIGKARGAPGYGWDNEYGRRQAQIAAFSISRYLVANGEYLDFVKDSGYSERAFWSDTGWRWRSFRNTRYPAFWIPQGPAGLHVYRLRTLFEEIDLPLDWPVCVNAHEARAYLAWRSRRDGRGYRLPTEAEHVYLRRGSSAAAAPADPVMHFDSSGFAAARAANLNLAWGSEGPVDGARAGAFGVHDVAGNVWDWCEDDFHPLDGFAVHPLYEDFSTPCFDGEHAMILGGSFISTGNEASHWARFHFRPHFLQHAGLHVVASSETRASAVRLREHGASKYDNRQVLDQYLLFHHGDRAHALPAGVDPGTGAFPQRCARKLIEAAQAHGCGLGSVLDVGCAVGGASFELARAFERVVGVDISAQFIDTSEALRQGRQAAYSIVLEGEISEQAVASMPAGVDGGRLEFRRADACSLPADWLGFDAVLAANLLCRLPSPKAFLGRLGGARGLVRPGGIVVFASPFSWSEQYTTKECWLGGTGARWSADGLRAALGEEFELLEQLEFPFMIREHRRKFEYVVSDLTVWRRKPPSN